MREMVRTEAAATLLYTNITSDPDLEMVRSVACKTKQAPATGRR
jgi:hypothetical protein